MSNLPQSTPKVHPAFPTHDHEGTRIDYTDDPSSWVNLPPEYEPGPRAVDPGFCMPSQPEAFLDDDSDFRQSEFHSRYTIVARRPLTPNRPVELAIRQGKRWVTIGWFPSLQAANDIGYLCGAVTIGIREMSPGEMIA